MVIKHIDVQATSLTLDELLSELDSDTEIILMRGDAPIARIAGVNSLQLPKIKTRILGLHEGQGWISDDFTDDWVIKS